MWALIVGLGILKAIGAASRGNGGRYLARRYVHKKVRRIF